MRDLIKVGRPAGSDMERVDWGASWAPALALLAAPPDGVSDAARTQACGVARAARVLCKAVRDAVDAERVGVVVRLQSPNSVRNRCSVAQKAAAIVSNARIYVETARTAAGLLARARGARRIVLDNKAAQFANGLRDGMLRALAHELARVPAAAGRVTSLVLIGLDQDDEPTDAAMTTLLRALPNIETLHVHDSSARGLTGACLGALAEHRGRPLARLLCTGPMYSGMRGVPPDAVASVSTQWKDLLYHYRQAFRWDTATAVRAIRPLDAYGGLLRGLRLHHACGYLHH